MSGIVGLLELDGAPVELELLEAMTSFQEFRGPHGRGVWAAGSVGFGHTFFETMLGASDIAQPLCLDNVWITADARIDGRAELVRGLREKTGREVPGTASDDALILHAYHAWGDGCLQHLIGDFAFALWDAPRRRMLCAVDHWGVKPLYYACLGTHFALANTLDCVRLHPAVSDTLNDAAVADFLLFGVYYDRDATIYADVSRIPPAHLVTVENGVLARRRYWGLSEAEELRIDTPDVLSQFKRLLDAAVGDRLRTDRVAVFMSGGVDSPLVAAAAKRRLAGQNQRFELTAVTAVFERLIPHDERVYAENAARALSISVRIVLADDFEIYGRGDGLPWPPPEPSSDPRWTWEVGFTSEAAAVAPVVLTGWDGDAVLAATTRRHWAYRARRGEWWQLLRDLGAYARVAGGPPPIGVRTALKGLFAKPARRLPDWLQPAFVLQQRLEERLARGDERPRPGPRGAALDLLESPAWASILDPYDAGWLGFPLEVRHPLMDLRLVEFLLRLPAVPWCVDKMLFRTALAEVLPSSLSARPKTGLRKDPITACLRGLASWSGDRRPLDPRLLPYVDGARLGPLAGCDNVQEVWKTLPPHGLWHWLEARRMTR